MEASFSTPTPYSRAQRPSYMRVTSTFGSSAAQDSRMAFSNIDRRASNLTPSPQPSLQYQQEQQPEHSPYLVHRFQNAPNTPSSPSPANTETLRYRLPREASEEPKLCAMSTYLQEKLLRERKVEGERSASRTSNERAAVELRATQNSPRSPSGSGNGDPVKKKSGFSLKEMEQTLTTLHKQNFDLKLELYHRRERQSSLEEQCETLETEKRELDEINDKLMSELEMRDKAVEEAVSMIITLEARLEQLLREREMVQQVEKQTLLAADTSIRRALSCASRGMAGSSYDETPRPKHKHEDGRTLARMPSFLSERSENTENLRNVYLGSLVSLPRMTEDLDGDFPDATNRVGSPSLSVLSESSFLSIYGEGNESCMPVMAPLQQEVPSSVPADIPRAIVEPSQNAEGRSELPHSSTTPKNLPPSMIRANSGPAGLNALTEFIGTNSPLQRLEKMEISLQAMSDASRPNSDDGQGIHTNYPTHKLHAQDFAKSSVKEKRDHLRRVRTDAPFTGSMGSHHNLPPTPDTISTSTLRRYKNSDDTLSQDKGFNETSYLVLSEVGVSENEVTRADPVVDIVPPQATSSAAFNNRLYDVGTQHGYFDSRLPTPRRPRSADETTLSCRGRTSVWGDSDSSDDDMDIDGNDSASMQDCWLRESLRPVGAIGRGRRGGRISPDLFNFPSTMNGWSTTEMFGKSGQGYPSSASGGGSPFARTLDALGASLPTPINGMHLSSGLLSSPLPYGMGSLPGPPPPPNRRSSLHAQTGSTHGMIASFGGSPGSEYRHGSAGPGTPMSITKSRKSPARAPADESICPSPMTTDRTQEKQTQARSAEPQLQPAGPQGQIGAMTSRHYPPNACSTPRSRVLSLFRRSGSHDQATAATTALSAVASASTPSAEPALVAAKNTSVPSMGIPSKVWRGELGGEGSGSSATPPPITGNGTSARGIVDANMNDGSGVLAASSRDVAPVQTPTITRTHEGGVQAAQARHEDSHAMSAGGSGRKKWLGLGRVATLRSRTG